MARPRLILVVFVTWLVVAAVNPVVHADAYAYDVPVTACVDVHCLGAAEAITELLSDVREVSATRSAEGRGTSTTSSASFLATEYGGGALPENLSASDALRIQNAANKIGTPISVVGSRAGGTAGAWSDWDYVITGANSATKGKIRNSLPDGPRGVGDARNIDIFDGAVNADLPYITFNPC